MNAFVVYSAIRTTGQYLPANFPEIDREISVVKTLIKELANADHCAVIISYFKDHRVRADLARSQSVLVDILLSMKTCRHIEGLFEASKENEPFATGFEYYLLNELRR